MDSEWSVSDRRKLSTKYTDDICGQEYYKFSWHKTEPVANRKIKTFVWNPTLDSNQDDLSLERSFCVMVLLHNYDWLCSPRGVRGPRRQGNSGVTGYSKTFLICSDKLWVSCSTYDWPGKKYFCDDRRVSNWECWNGSYTAKSSLSWNGFSVRVLRWSTMLFNTKRRRVW